MLRTFVRLLEMALPVQSVLWTHLFFLGFDFFFYVATGNDAGCSTLRVVSGFAVMALGLLGTFSWGTWQTTHRSFREGLTAALLYASYCYAVFPDVWVCSNAQNAVVLQIAVCLALGIAFAQVLLSMTLTLLVRSRQRQQQHRLASDTLSDDKELESSVQ
jgi:hypothetical protein